MAANRNICFSGVPAFRSDSEVRLEAWLQLLARLLLARRSSLPSLGYVQSGVARWPVRQPRQIHYPIHVTCGKSREAVPTNLERQAARIPRLRHRKEGPRPRQFCAFASVTVRISDELKLRIIYICPP